MATDKRKTGKGARTPTDGRHPLDVLHATIVARKGADPETSYTAKLFARGRAKIAQKLGEEAVETVIEAIRDDRAKLAEESADLLYHLLVVWADANLEPEAVYAILAERQGLGGLAEKAQRGGRRTEKP